MRPARLALRLALSLSALTALACGDDDKKGPDEQPINQLDASTDGAVEPSIDAAVARDSSTADGAVQADGATGSEVDATAPLDAAADTDAATSSDAGGDAGAADAGSCPIDDSRLGCGRKVADHWYRFDNGLEVDTRYGRAWSPVENVANAAALQTKCAGLVLGTLENFEAPEIEDVRTLAAGCASTLPSTQPVGGCRVQSGDALAFLGIDCDDCSGTGPNDGRFCRAEVSSCETLWTLTTCTDCSASSRWFYDAQTGNVVANTPSQAVWQAAKGRCFAPFTGTLP